MSEIKERLEKHKDIYTSSMPWWKKMGSAWGRDIQEEIDLWKSFPGIGQQESGPHPALGRLIHYMAHGLPLGSTNKHIGNTIELGTIKAYGNALKSVDDMGDSLKEGIGLGTNEYSDFERGVDNWVDDAYSLNNHLPPSQMTQQQKAGDEARAALVLNVFLMGLGAQTSSVLNTAFPQSKALQAFDPSSAKTNWQMIRRIMYGNMLDEIPSTFLDDNRDSWFSKEGQTMTEASQSSFLPHLAISSAFGGLVSAPQLKALAQKSSTLDLTKNLDFSSLQAGELYKNITNILPNTKRAKVSSGFAEDRRIIRQQQIDNQIINSPSETGETTFTDAINAKPAESTATIESDTLQETLERGASDQDLDEILTSDNVIEGVENTLSRPGGGVDLPLKQDDVSAPIGSLAPSDTLYSNQLGKVPTDNLLSLANPNNSPRLTQKITEITGKEFNQFDRTDVIKGIKAFEQSDGVSVMPNRLMGGQSLRVDDISVDPARFQYKGGIDDTGVQKGGSLEGVDKWNMNMEGRSLVWEDPADGKTYIVEGHNRLQKAKELGIPSINVDYLTAPEAGGARAQGALSNIAAGSGTPFDAAKFFKSAGINDPSEVAGLGVPLKSGMATRGLALSKLPDNIFQDAVDGTLTQGRAISLGGSGLDEAGMQTAYKALKDKDITDATFTEVIQQAKSAPTVEGGQVDLFGNTDMLNLMVEKGKLAASIRKNIVQNKNLFSTVGRNADTIEGAGSVIDRATAQQIKLDAESVLPQFDALKYSPGKISDLLNEGAQEISQGAKVNVVAKRIQRQILDEIKPQKTTPSSVADEVIPEEGADLGRNEKINQIVAKAAANGEVRPPTTPLIKTPATSGVSLEKVADDLAAGKITDDVQKAIGDEIRLSEEFEKMDLGMKAAETDGKRSGMGWDGMTFEEKKANGLVPEKLSDVLRENLRELAQSDARRLREVDRILKESRAVDEQIAFEDGLLPAKKEPFNIQSVRDAIDSSDAGQTLEKSTSRKIQPGTPHPTDANKVRGFDGRWVTKKHFNQVIKSRKAANKIKEELAPGSTRNYDNDPITQSLKARRELHALNESFELPSDLKRFKPRYGPAVPEFESALDAVAYSIRSNANKSKREDDYVAALRKFGYNPAEVAEHGKKVHQYVKDFVKEKRGTAQSQAAAGLDIKVPDFKFKSGDLGIWPDINLERQRNIRSSAFPPDVDFTGGKYPGDESMRNYYRRVQERELVREADYLAEWGAKIADSDMGRLAQSKLLAGEAVEAVRAAAITSGVMPERIRWIDEVDMTKLFGEEEHIGAMRNWSPQAATFMARNPGDPLNKTAAGLTTGVYISQTFEKPIRGSIALALNPSIDQRFGGALRKLPSSGRKFYTLAEHEAFHGVQEFLHLSGDKKLIAALKTPQAIEEMKEIIRKSRGNTMENMDILEIQAEAFGNWANNRNIKLKDGGLKASFEKIKKFLNGVRAKVRKILRKDPTYIDIFEMAHSGELARKKMLNTLSPAQLDAYAKRIDKTTHEQLPELTERIHDYLTAKKLEYDTLINGWELDAASGGCL